MVVALCVALWCPVLFRLYLLGDFLRGRGVVLGECLACARANTLGGLAAYAGPPVKLRLFQRRPLGRLWGF